MVIVKIVTFIRLFNIPALGEVTSSSKLPGLLAGVQNSSSSSSSLCSSSLGPICLCSAPPPLLVKCSLPKSITMIKAWRSMKCSGTKICGADKSKTMSQTTRRAAIVGSRSPFNSEFKFFFNSSLVLCLASSIREYAADRIFSERCVVRFNSSGILKNSETCWTTVGL